jgi:hypothetical protein
MVADVRRTTMDFLSGHPVELLVLGNLNEMTSEVWLRRIPGDQKIETPQLVLEFWDPWHIARNSDGPMSKLVTTRWTTLGYNSSCISANATQVGGVVDRKWLICSRIFRQAKIGPDWPELPQEIIRPMANCLRPVGVPGSAYLKSDNYSYRPMPAARNDCMPAIPGAFIRMKHGPRRLLHDELCNGLGVRKPWILGYPDGKTVQRTIALQLLEFITPLLLQPAVPRPIPVPEMPLRRSKVVANV